MQLFICWIIIFPSIAWIIWENLTLRSPGAIQGAIEWQSVATMANIHMFSHQDELHWPQFGELRSFRAILKYEPTQINRSNFTIQALSWAAQQVIVVEPLVQTSDIHDREVSLALPNDQSFLCVGDFGALMRWILIKTMKIQWNYHNFYHWAPRIDDNYCGIFLWGQ